MGLIWTRNDQYLLQLEYGCRAWAADVTMHMQFLPGWPGKASDFFGKSSPTPEFASRRTGSEFARIFAELTDYNEHQMETTAFYFRQRKDSSETFNTHSALVIRKHKDDFNLEVTLRASLWGDKKERGYEFLLGFNYGTDDVHFQPNIAEKPSFLQAMMYTYFCKSLDPRYTEDKFPLLVRRYSASLSEKSAYDLRKPAEIEVKVSDERLRGLVTGVQRKLTLA